MVFYRIGIAILDQLISSFVINLEFLRVKVSRFTKSCIIWRVVSNFRDRNKENYINRKTKEVSYKK